MDDLISRQAAITLPVLPKEYREYQTSNLDDAYEQGWNDLQKCIESLPSAQQWIPCSERLPEKSGKYLVSCKANAYSNITTTAQWQNRYKHWDMTGARSHWRVDAWMPLTEPYKGEANG